jgi:hypothetical protein
MMPVGLLRKASQISAVLLLRPGQTHQPTNRRLDKSVAGGSWIVIVAQRFSGTRATPTASLPDQSRSIFKYLDASHPSERAILCDG